MIKEPFFSIVIPTYNSAQKLKRALDSVNKQTFRDFEVIVCDDGSLDHTKQVADSFNGNFDLKYIRNEHWGGPALPRNNGIKIAQGAYIAFLDVDDWWYPDKLGHIKGYLHGADILYHDFDIHTPQGKKIFKKVRGRHLKTPVFTDLMINGNALMTSGVVVRKAIVDKVGGLAEDKALISVEDFDLWLKIARVTEQFIYIPQVLGAYWTEENNISYASEELIKRTKEVYCRHLIFLKDSDKKESGMILSYLLGRIKQRMGFLREALQLFKVSMNSRNIKFKLRSLCWVVLISILSGLQGNKIHAELKR